MASSMDIQESSSENHGRSSPRSSTAIQEEENDALKTATAQVGNDESMSIPSTPLTKKEGSSYYSMPKCALLPPQELGPVEKFVADAIAHKTNTTTPTGTGQSSEQVDAKQVEAYGRLVRAVAGKDDPALLRTILVALRTAGSGATLHLLSGNPGKHAQFLHKIIQFDPFEPPNRTKRKRSQNNNTPTKVAAAAAEQDEDPTNLPFHDLSIADAYFNLILTLVSANSVFLVSSMTFLWNLLGGLSSQASILPESTIAHRMQRIHATLAAMTLLCPKGKTELFTIMTTNFPFMTRPKEELLWCYQQLLEVAEYVPSMHGQVLRFIIDKSLEMDVEIKVHQGGEVEREEKNDETFNLDNILMEEETRQRQRQQQQKEDVTVHDMIEKLDSLLSLAFQFLAKGSDDLVALRRSYECCLSAFESSILITHRSKFVQFLLFYICGLESQMLEQGNDNQQLHAAASNTLNRDFAADLIKITFDPYRSTVVRQSAACYLASFCSRATFVEVETATESVCAFLQWADAYIASWQENGFVASSADVWEQSVDLHSLFFTICQAAFYIMCFRGQEIMQIYHQLVVAAGGEGQSTSTTTTSVPEHLRDLQLLLEQADIGPKRWQRLCCHSLQPMMYCVESVRHEFLQIALSYNLLDGDMVKSLRTTEISHIPFPDAIGTGVVPSNSSGKRPTKVLNPLKSFFPFDLYKLEQSHVYVTPFYRKWVGGGPQQQQLDTESVVTMEETETAPSVVSKADDANDGSTLDEEGDNDDDDELEEDNDGDEDLKDSVVEVRSPPQQPGPASLVGRNRGLSIDSAGSW